MIQVELHDRTNAKIKILSGAKNAAWHAVLNNAGAGSFLIHRSDADVAALNIIQGGIDGCIVHLLRKGPLETAFSDRFTFVVEPITGGVSESEEDGAWITVSGRGSLSLLEDRIALPPGFNDTVSPPTLTAQWQTYVATTGGAIMGAEINRSAGRFTLVLTHTVDTSTILQTVKLRFDNLLKLHEYLVSNGMDAQMVGLDYQASDHLGTDKSATVRVQLSHEDSLLGLSFERDSRPVKNWVVAQGTGEGINAKLAVAKDVASIAAFRRREGFLDDSQDDVQSQIGLRASSAVAQLKDANQRITVKFTDSPACQIYRDVGLGDKITLAAVPLSWSAPYRVVGIQVADTEAEIETVNLDLNDMRTENLLRLASGAQLTADTLNVINRMPQGAPFNDSHDYTDNCNATFPFHFVVFIPSNVLKLNYGKLSFFLQAFRTYNTFSGSITGGQSVTHTHASAAHAHTLPIDAGPFTNAAGQNAAGGNLATGFGPTTAPVNSTTPGATGNASVDHTHTLSISSVLGIFEGTTATGVLVTINGTDRTAALGGGTGFTADQLELEVSQYLNIGQKNTVDLTPTALGRILGHLRLTGYVQSV